MSQLQTLIDKAQSSTFNRWLLNRALAYTVPFNAPHKFKVVDVSKGRASISLPYRRSNLNHVKGIHACALSTLCEFTTGLALLSKIDETQYRIILKNLNCEYHFQARKNVIAHYQFNDEWLEQNVYLPLQNQDAVFITLNIEVHDSDQNHICTGIVMWQVKKWDRVKSVK